jgi:hypothetical protein
VEASRRSDFSQSRALATLGIGPSARWLAYSGETFRRYALKHGYEYVQGSGAMPEGRPAAWAKIPLLQRLLEAFELVVWIDADATILDDSRDIASELAPDTWQALVASDLTGREGRFVPNTAVWVLRRTPRTHGFLQAVWDSVDFIDRTYWENAAVLHLLGFTYEAPIRLVDPAAPWLEGTQWLAEEWNRIPGPWADEPARIRHWAGVDYPLRARQLRADLAYMDGQRIRPACSRIEWNLSRQHPFLYRVVSSVRYRAVEKPKRAIQKAYRGAKSTESLARTRR